MQGYNPRHCFIVLELLCASFTRLTGIWAKISTARAAPLNIRPFSTGCWKRHNPIRWMPLLWQAIFLIPAHRQAMPVSCITVLSLICSKPAVIWWYWQATTTPSPHSMSPAIFWRFSTPQSLPAPVMRRRFYCNVTARRGRSCARFLSYVRATS